MGLTASDSGGGDFKPAPEGPHVARCVSVVDLGTQPGSQQFPTPRHKVMFAWELPNVLEEIEGQQVPKLVFKRYSMSLHENSRMRKDLQTWRGKVFTADELAGFALRKVLGAPGMVSITHSPDGQHANIDAIMAVPPGMECSEAHHDLVYYEIEEGANATYETFGDKLKATIRSAPEWPGNAVAAGDPGPSDDDIPF
jgi:hypothetical protein